MTSFNESAINRDDDGKFAAKTTAETDSSVLSGSSSKTVDEMMRRRGADGSASLTPYAHGDSELGNIRVEDDGDGYRASASAPGPARTSGPFVAEAAKLSAVPRDYADFLRSNYGADEMSSDQVRFHMDDSFEATPTFSAHIEAGTGVDEMPRAIRRNGMDDYLEDERSGNLASQFYAWKSTYDSASSEAESSWKASRNTPFPEDAFRKSYIDNPSDTSARRATWGEDRNDDGTLNVPAGTKGHTYASSSAMHDTYNERVAARANSRSFTTWTDRVSSAAMENNGDGTFTQKVSDAELDEIIERHTTYYDDKAH